MLLGVVTEYLGIGPLHGNRVVVGLARRANKLGGILGHHVLVGQGLVVVSRRFSEAVDEQQIVVPVDHLVIGVGAGQSGPASQVEVGKSGNQNLLGRRAHCVFAVIDLGCYGHGHVVVLLGALHIGVGIAYLLTVNVHVHITLTRTSYLNGSVKCGGRNGRCGGGLQRRGLHVNRLGRRVADEHARLQSCGSSRDGLVLSVDTSHGDGDGARSGCRLAADIQGYLSVGR